MINLHLLCDGLFCLDVFSRAGWKLLSYAGKKNQNLTHCPINKDIGQVSSAIGKKNTGEAILAWYPYSCGGNMPVWGPKRSSLLSQQGLYLLAWLSRALAKGIEALEVVVIWPCLVACCSRQLCALPVAVAGPALPFPHVCWLLAQMAQRYIGKAIGASCASRVLVAWKCLGQNGTEGVLFQFREPFVF